MLYNKFESLQCNDECSKVTAGQYESSYDILVQIFGHQQVNVYKGDTVHSGHSSDLNAA